MAKANDDGKGTGRKHLVSHHHVQQYWNSETVAGGSVAPTILEDPFVALVEAGDCRSMRRRHLRTNIQIRENLTVS
ncbi:MAG: hypothetical protein EOS27_06680 [Mesorhizobium sp.]|nr:MAG: hypothetical protein EOS27_06680 [Mesorhizobium sp.]